MRQTPGYQFTLAQGLKATQSAAAARGLGVSGSALKGAGTYATGLADKTYLDQFNVAQQRFGDVLNLNTAQQGNLQAQFGRLSGLATIWRERGSADRCGWHRRQRRPAATTSTRRGWRAQPARPASATQRPGGVNNYLAYNAAAAVPEPDARGVSAVSKRPECWRLTGGFPICLWARSQPVRSIGQRHGRRP